MGGRSGKVKPRFIWLGWDGDRGDPYITYNKTRTAARRRGLGNSGDYACLYGFNRLTGLNLTTDELKKGVKLYLTL
jgi:hypothetical protein